MSNNIRPKLLPLPAPARCHCLASPINPASIASARLIEKGHFLMRKTKTNNTTLHAVRRVNGKVNGAPVKTQSIDEKCQKLTESVASVIEDPECPT